MHSNRSDPQAQKRPLVTAPPQKLEKAIGKDGDTWASSENAMSPVGT